ncbi:MAG TPA: malectin domain-containing carbohydrate-binding protein, partial [Phycisphaerae bacterium]|nr:malectin domain-containing carbohydrate-binding protein [Phycisphaerae bacterium]
TVAGTNDPTLYAHGIHGQDFTAYATVAPGTYHVRLKFMEHRWEIEPAARAVDIFINGRQVVDDMDIAATAAGAPAVVRLVPPSGTKLYDGLNRAVDLVFNDVRPVHGVIAIRFRGNHGGEAIVSALEIGPGAGGQGATPVPATASQPAQ